MLSRVEHAKNISEPVYAAVTTYLVPKRFEPRREKTCLRGFRPGPTDRTVQPQKMTRGSKIPM